MHLPILTRPQLVGSQARPKPSMNMRRYGRAALGLLLSIFVGLTWADSAASLQAPSNPMYRQECGSCHLAYPPGLLPEASWGRLMQDLSRHFGADASLSPDEQQALSRYLKGNAGTYKKVQEAPPQDRITRSTWFTREHRKLPAAIWSRPSVGSQANCVACHRQANQGDFDEHRVRIPQ